MAIDQHIIDKIIEHYRQHDNNIDRGNVATSTYHITEQHEIFLSYKTMDALIRDVALQARKGRTLQ